jgi:hypothetical protein
MLSHAVKNKQFSILENPDLYPIDDMIYQSLWDEAIEVDSLNLLKIMFKNQKPYFIKLNNVKSLAVLKWLHELNINQKPKQKVEIETLCVSNPKVKFYHNNVQHQNTSAADCMAANGNLGNLIWLISTKKYNITTKAMNDAAANGRLKVVKWLHKLRTEGCTKAAIEEAAANGHLHVISWLVANRPNDCKNSSAVYKAAANGKLHVLKWFIRHNFRGSENIIDIAAVNGHLDVVTWLHKVQGEKCTSEAMEGAAANGHFETATWVYNNYKFNHCLKRTVIFAIEYGNLNYVKKWLPELSSIIENGTHLAVINGHLELADWLMQNQYTPISSNTVILAVARGSLDTIKWIYDNFQDEIFNTKGLIDTAAVYGHLEIIKWLHTFTTSLATTNAIDYAAANGHLEVVQWLYQNRNEGYTDAAINYAIKTGYNNVVNWLIARKT